MLKASAKRVLLPCLTAALLAACSRSDPPSSPGSTSAAGSAAQSSAVPLSTEASVTTAAPPVGERPGSVATPSVAPPEDRLEPVPIENARLPGGGTLPADPSEKRSR